MKFLYPEFLWALLLLAIPIIIHLFNFKRYKTLYFSSLSFIKHVDQQTKSTQKLKHILVLVSRLLAFAFLILAFAQPYFDSSENKAQTKSNLACIYLDNSYSMQLLGSEGELLSEAREKAKELVENASMDTRFLISTNEMNGREERILNKVEALEKIDNITYSPLSRSVNDVVFWQVDNISKKQKSENTIFNSKYYLFSDFQKSTTNVTGKDAEFKGEFYPIQLLGETHDNIFIDSVWFTAPNHQVNTKCELNFKVVNTSDQKLENVEISITVDTFKKTLFVDIPAKGSKNSKLTYTDKTSGTKKGKISALDKNVFFDDSFFFSYDVEQNSKVLIVNGKDFIDNFGLIYSLDDYFVITEKDVTALTSEDFNAKDLVVINGVNELSSGIETYLNEFTSTGGTVALFPGTEPSKNGWNNFLSSAKLPVIGKPISSGTKIKTLKYEDPFFDGMFEKKSSNLNLPSVTRSFQAIKTQNLANDLILLQNGLPLLSYAESKGKVYMFYSSVHSSFGKFANDALFSSVLLRLGEISNRPSPLYLEIGSEASYPVYDEVDDEKVLHIKNQESDFIPQQSQISGVTYLALNKLDNVTALQAGNFDIANTSNYGAISLNYNRIESDLTILSANEITSIFGTGDETKVKYNEISANSNFSTLDIDKPFAYWKICIIITLIFVATEMLLIRFLK